MRVVARCIAPHLWLALLSGSCDPHQADREGCPAGEHDGGDGTCLAGGTCIDDFALDGEGRCRGFKRLPARLDNRASAAVATLQDGRIVIAGGWQDTNESGFAEGLSRVDIYDSKTDEWTRGPSLIRSRAGAQLVPYGDGELMLIGGAQLDIGLDETEILNASGTEWRAGPPLNQGRHFHAAHALRDGTVLVFAGFTGTNASSEFLYDVEVLRPGSEAFETTGAVPAGVGGLFCRIAELSENRALIIGDSQASVLVSPPDYAPTTWALREASGRAAAVVELDDDHVLVAGGYVPGDAIFDLVEMYVPSAEPGFEQRTPLPAPLVGRGHRISDDEVLVYGGDGETSAAHLYDVTEDAWSSFPFPADFRLGGSTWTRDGGVVLLGACDPVGDQIPESCEPVTLRFLYGE